jgi:hypothetical protein
MSLISTSRECGAFPEDHNIYLLTSIRPPKQLIEDIDQMRRYFLWAGDSEISGGKCKVAWTTVAKPVDFGGLGIIDLHKFSKALRLRWLWFQWSNPERPRRGTELPVNTEDVALFNAATIVTIKNGKKASFWHSSWIEGKAPASLYPRLYAHSKRKNRTVREALLGEKWIRDIAYNLTHDLLKEYFELWTAISTPSDLILMNQARIPLFGHWKALPNTRANQHMQFSSQAKSSHLFHP